MRTKISVAWAASTVLLQSDQGTAKALEERGILTDLIPEVYDGDALGEALAAKLHGWRKNPSSQEHEKGNQNLVKILKNKRCQEWMILQHMILVYETSPADSM